MKKKRLKIFFNALFLIISFTIIIYFCVEDNNLFTLIRTISSMDLFWLVIAVLAFVGNWILDGICIKDITQYATGKNYSFRNAFSITISGSYWGAITPGATGCQPAQIFKMSKQGIRGKLALSIVIRKYMVYQVVFILYSLILIVSTVGYFSEEISGFMYLAFIGVAAQSAPLLFILLFSMNRNLTLKSAKMILKFLKKIRIIKDDEENLKKFEEQMDFYLKITKNMNKNVMLTIKTLLLTLFQVTLIFSIPFYIYKAYYGTGMPYFEMLAAQAFVLMISSAVPLPGSSGASEQSFIMIYSLFFVKTILKPTMLLWRFITYYFTIIFGLIYLLFDRRPKRYMERDVQPRVSKSV